MVDKEKFEWHGNLITTRSVSEGFYVHNTGKLIPH